MSYGASARLAGLLGGGASATAGLDQRLSSTRSNTSAILPWKLPVDFFTPDHS